MNEDSKKEKKSLITSLVDSINKLSDSVKGLAKSNKTISKLIGIVVLLTMVFGLIKVGIETYQMFGEKSIPEIKNETNNLEIEKEDKNVLGFDKNPNDKTGIVSIAEGDCIDCGGDTDTLKINIPNSGDSTLITVFLDYMTKRNSLVGINSVRAYYMTKETRGTSPTFEFKAALTGHNVKRIIDFSTITGLPSSYEISFLKGHIENEHGGINPNGFHCDESFDYFEDIDDSLFTSKGFLIGDLPIDGGCWCAQGTVAIKYRVTNTTK